MLGLVPPGAAGDAAPPTAAPKRLGVRCTDGDAAALILGDTRSAATAASNCFCGLLLREDDADELRDGGTDAVGGGGRTAPSTGETLAAAAATRAGAAAATTGAAVAAEVGCAGETPKSTGVT
jgi:hypothetical protein